MSESIDLKAFCGAAADDVGLAICAVNANLDDTRASLNTFFLLYAVRLVFAVVIAQLLVASMLKSAMIV